jgi:hypothetical protein
MASELPTPLSANSASPCISLYIGYNLGRNLQVRGIDMSNKSSFLKLGLAISFVAASSARVALADHFGPTTIYNPASDVVVEASTSGLRVAVRNDDSNGSRLPFVVYTFDSVKFFLMPFVRTDDLGGGFFLDHFRLDRYLDCGTRGRVLVSDRPPTNGIIRIDVSVNFSVSCSSLGSIRGTAYKDGRPFGGAWYKITDGGNWYTCGTVGSDGTFGVPVEPGTYYLIPLNLQGLRASGVTKVVVEGGKASLGNDIIYTSDPSAQHESCDLYNPPRPIPSNLR